MLEGFGPNMKYVPIDVYTDGACRLGNPGLCSSAFIVYKGGELFYRGGRVLEGAQTNNTAEYTALIDFLKWADKSGIRNAHIYCDSALVVNQTNQQWERNDPSLKKFSTQAYGYLIRGAHMLNHIKGHSGIAGNEEVDALCNVLLDKYMEEHEEQIKNFPAVVSKRSQSVYQQL